jgi:MOSC domain-containing protein YiiM
MSAEARRTPTQADNASAGRRQAGEVAEIYIAPRSGEEMTLIREARAEAGRGLEGDRYFEKLGTYSNIPEPGRQVTLVEMEAIEAVMRESGVYITPGDARRNLITRGVALNDLVGKQFRVGEATLVGVELCEPCAHLVSLIGKNVLRAFVHRGGIRADVVSSGMIRTGDRVEPVE